MRRKTFMAGVASFLSSPQLAEGSTMTDVDHLGDLANAITATGTTTQRFDRVRAYAQAQAAVTQAQEADIRKLIEEVEVLKAKAGGGTGAPPTVPPSPSPYGTLLPTRLPESTGAVTNVATSSALLSALSSVPDGSVINITSNFTGAGGTLVIDGGGAPSAPITITCTPGVSLSGFSQVLVRGSYICIRGLEVKNATIDNIKIDTNAHHIEVDGCWIHDSTRMGINVQAAPTDIQIWNCRINNNGDPANGNLDHGIYFAYARGQCVIANCLFYNEEGAYHMQLYPDAPGIIVTCCTVDGVATLHAGARGGIVVGSEAGLTDNVTVVGCLFTNAPWYAIDVYDPAGGDTNNRAFDCLGFNNTLGDFRAGGGFTYVNCTHADPLYVNRAAFDYRLQAGSPAISKVQAARYGYVPTTDITGAGRITADAGCYRA